MKKITILLLSCLVATSIFAQDATYKGQAPAKQVDTTSRAIEVQWKGNFEFKEDGVTFSNNFDGGRLNHIQRIAKDTYTITISPENSPINSSPWYAFQVHSDESKEIAVRLLYQGGVKHRYWPQTSRDGKNWNPVDPKQVEEEDKSIVIPGVGQLPSSITMRLEVSPAQRWISAQELQSSTHVFEWLDHIASIHHLQIDEIGKSTQGRPLKLLSFGDTKSKKMILVISRQHPPEVTGYFAMQSFVETLLADTELAGGFRKTWGIYVIPLMNPDGVDNGHWRHNAGGIDLNRDWLDFNQPETRAVRDFLAKKRTANQGKFYFGVDFHSTWDDIYYPMARQFVGNMPNLVWDWLEKVQHAIPNYAPNIQASDKLEPSIISRNFFLKEHGMESIVFEIGDKTPRGFIQEKGRVGAEELMKLMIAREE